MDEHDFLAEQFEENRTHLRAVAYRILGSIGEADAAVQEVWLRLSRSDTSSVENLRGWLTTVVGQVCLDVLRTRRSRREEPLGARFSDPIVGRQGGIDPEHEALLSDSVGLALLVILETLTPAARLASWRAASGEHSTIGVISPKGNPNVSCKTNASRAPQGAGERPLLPTPSLPASGRPSTPSSLPRASSPVSTRRELRPAR